MLHESQLETTGTIRILVVDDHPRTRAGIASILHLDPGCCIAGEANNGLEAVEVARAICPDIVLMDINLPEIDGFEAANRIRQVLPQTRIIFISQHDEQAYEKKALDLKGSGYIRKSELVKELLRAIRIVHGGGIFFPDLSPDHS